MQATAEFKLDFVGGWTQSRYVEAQASLEEFVRRYPLVLPRATLRERRVETRKMREALEELGLISDIPKLSAIGVRKRTMLAVVEQDDIDRLGLAGSLAQYRSVYEPALDECECPSPDCDPREICPDELLVRLAGVKQLQDLIEEKYLESARQLQELVQEERREREECERARKWAKKVRSDKAV